MGALPSRETQRRGLYSHRHGRNRRNEVVLIPLTAEFFPDAHCPLFERLYEARHHRTAKYYYRAVRPANTDRNSDFYCQTTAHAQNIDLDDPEGLNKDGVFERLFSDDIESLYQRLVTETEYCICETDEELRQRYMKQLQEEQQRKQQRTPQFPNNNVNVDGGFGVDQQTYMAGYRDALAYMHGKEQHTHRHKNTTHVTSPAAFYLRPVPCAIVSRFDAQRPHAERGVEFFGFTVKVLGMFGLFPTTIPITINGETVEQHMLKATMFVDKDVGDQILGNVVLLAAHMYVRQCMEARIRAQYIPMVPFLLRTPISNIPMLQFLREMRVRLQSLLDAGTLRTETSPFPFAPNSGKGGSSAAAAAVVVGVDGSDARDAAGCKQDTDAFLFEEDVPNCTSTKQLFVDALDAKWLRSQSRQNTNTEWALPIIMMSGVNVQTAPLKHSSLSNMSHVRIPPWAASTNGDNSTGNLQRTTTQQQQQQQVSKLACLPFFLARRRSRFRMWIENGQLCIWVSAAYARRGSIILAQQLTMAVDGILSPLSHTWNYRGLLRGGVTVPAPIYMNDVFVVESDMPSVGLFQGDILRCSTEREIAERQLQQQQQQQQRFSSVTTPIKSSAPQFDTVNLRSVLSTTNNNINNNNSNNTNNNNNNNNNNNQSSSSSNGFASFTDLQMAMLNNNNNTSSSGGGGGQINVITSPELVEAPEGSFWVRVAESRLNNAPVFSFKRRRKSGTDHQQRSGDVSNKHINIEDVLLSWIKMVTIQTRDVDETENHWVRNPITNELLCIDRYLIRRVEHDNIRYFIGVASRLVGEQRRNKKMLLEKAKPSCRAESNLFTDDGEDVGECSEVDNGNLLRGQFLMGRVRSASFSFDESSFSASEGKLREIVEPFFAENKSEK